MYPQLQQNPAPGGGSRQTVKSQKRNKPDPEARIDKTETPAKAENMAKEPEQNAPLTITLPDFVRYEVREGISVVHAESAERFAEMQTENAERFAAMQAESAERFAEMQTENAERFAEIRVEFANEWKKQFRIILTALAVMTAIIGLLIRFLEPAAPAYPPVIIHSPPAPTVTETPVPAATETPAADPPAPLPLDAE